MVLGQVTGLAVCTPKASRTVEIRLRVPDGVNPAKGTYKLTYSLLAK